MSIGYSIIGDKSKEAMGEYQHIHDLMKLTAKKNDFDYD